MIRRGFIISFIVIILGAAVGYIVAREFGVYAKGIHKNSLSDCNAVSVSGDSIKYELPLRFAYFSGIGSFPDTSVLWESYNRESTTGDWVHLCFGEDSVLLNNLSQFLKASEEVMKKGLCISDFSSDFQDEGGQIRAEAYLLMEGEKPLASSSVLSKVYQTTKSYQDDVVKEGFEAVKMADDLKHLLLGIEDKVSYNHELFNRILASVAYEKDLFTLLAYYRQYFMRYYHWLESGDAQAKVDYRLALGQFSAVKTHHLDKYGRDADSLGLLLDDIERGMQIARKTPYSIIAAKVSLVLYLFLLLMGLPGIGISRGSRKFASSLLFDSVFRPHRISRLNSYYRTGTIAVISIGLFVSGTFIFSGFSATVFPAILASLVLIYVLLLSWFISSSGNYLKSLITLMGPVLLTMAFLLIFAAIRGTGFFWFKMWTSETFSLIIFMVMFAMLLMCIHLHVIAGRKWSDRSSGASAGIVFSLIGIIFLIAALGLKIAGIENVLSVLNDELLLFPGKVTGITEPGDHRGILSKLPFYVICVSFVFLVSGSLLFIFNRRKTATVQRFTRN